MAPEIAKVFIKNCQNTANFSLQMNDNPLTIHEEMLKAFLVSQKFVAQISQDPQILWTSVHSIY